MIVRDVERESAGESWQTYRDLLSASGRGQAWSRAGLWAVDVLAERLDERWPAVALKRSQRDQCALPLRISLVLLSHDVLALADVVEWAARLQLIDGVPGSADARRPLASDVTEARIRHTDLQLQLAGAAARLGWSFRLEPLVTGARRPADLEISTDRGPLVIEAFALGEADYDRRRRDFLDRALHRLQSRATAHRVWLEGDLGEILDEATVRELERRIPVEALAARAGHKPEIRVGSASVRLVRIEDDRARLSARGRRRDLWPRMGSEIIEKAVKQMSGSGARWLRLVPHNFLFLETAWAQLQLADKLGALANNLSRLTYTGDSGAADTHPAGVVISSGAGLAHSTVKEETVQSQSGVALRRAISPHRARETFIIPLEPSAWEVAGAWQALADTEADWLPWALARFGLPDLDAILADN